MTKLNSAAVQAIVVNGGSTLPDSGYAMEEQRVSREA